MNNQATLGKMNKMKLYGMARAFQASMETPIDQQFTADELIGHLVDKEWDDRHERKLNRLIRQAKFRYKASIPEIDLTTPRNLDKNMILRLSDCSWLDKKQDIIIAGPTGSGKSFISCALGYQACIYEFKTLYYNARKLFSRLKQLKADNSHIKELKKIERAELLIIDDFGVEKLDTQNRLNLLEIFEDRHGLKSTILVSQLPVNKWHDVIGDQTIADAVCDRIIHSSLKIKLKGDSMRKKLKIQKK